MQKNKKSKNTSASKNKKFILWFDEIGINDVPLVGGKNASLGEMYTNLTKKGINIPNGFAISAYSYFYLLDKTGAKENWNIQFRDFNTMW
jgi:pyruvate,water dikinase